MHLVYWHTVEKYAKFSMRIEMQCVSNDKYVMDTRDLWYKQEEDYE